MNNKLNKIKQNNFCDNLLCTWPSFQLFCLILKTYPEIFHFLKAIPGDFLFPASTQ